MARVTVEDCLRNVDSRFTLVHLAVRRVLQLRSGAPLTMENIKGNKEVVMALREIAARTITVDNVREVEESRPMPVESLGIGTDLVARADLVEILDEAASLGPAIDFDIGTEIVSEPTEPEEDL